MDSIPEDNRAQPGLENPRQLRTRIPSKTRHYGLSNEKSSLISVDHQASSTKSDDTLRDHDQIFRTLNSSNTLDQMAANSDYRSITTNVRQCSLTEMLLVYAQQDFEASTNLKQSCSESSLMNIFNVLELHFNTYADDQRHIYFEGIFQVLHDFKEQITELVLIETMQFLQIDLLTPCTFEDFILILCHLSPIKSGHHSYLNVFNELDHNKDSYITLEDIQTVLPHLTSHFDEEIIRAAIQIIDTDHDNDQLSYFDFVTSFIALQECKLTIKTKA